MQFFEVVPERQVSRSSGIRESAFDKSLFQHWKPNDRYWISMSQPQGSTLAVLDAFKASLYSVGS